MPHRLPLATLPLLVIGLLLAPALAEPAGLTDLETDLWYVVRVGDQRAGYMRSTFTVDPDTGTAETTTTTRIRVKRGETEIAIEQDSGMTETLDGDPVAGRSRMKLGRFSVEQDYLYRDDAITVISRQLGGTQEMTLPPLKGEFYTPGQAGLRFAEAEAAGDEELAMRVLDPAAGVQPLAVSFRRVGEAPVEVFGKTVPATAWDVTLPISDKPIRQHLDPLGRPVRLTVDVVPGMSFDLVLADKELATAPVDAPELLARSLLRPDRLLPNPRETRRVVYEISLIPEAGAARVELPETGYQRVEQLAVGRWEVTVDLGDTVIEPRPSLPRYLASSTLINHDHPALARLPMPPDDRDMDRRSTAEWLRRQVARHLEQKDLSVGMATAAEAAQTRQGDCTEHAVLLTALLRRAGIPARTVTGLIYVTDFLGHAHVMGYHMWTQAWIDTRDDEGFWQDLDPSLPIPEGPQRIDAPLPGFDAAHVTLRVSALGDPSLTRDLLQIARLIGAFDVQILEAD